MPGSRTKKALLNTSFELLLEVVTAVCSFILPKLILSNFGSAYNGITTSISQFIGCIALLKSGIGGVTRSALYKPLAKNDYKGISEVTNATSIFLKKVAIGFIGGIILFAFIYPSLVSSDFDWMFSFTLVLILSISTIAQYFWGLTYQMVLQADQKNYIISIITIITTIANTIISAIMIRLGFGIRIVKLCSAGVFVIAPVFYNIYVRKKYKIDKKIPGNYTLIKERWDAFGHQVAAFINQNTDIMVATIFLGVKEVSVYSIYYMVGNAVLKVIKAFSTGTTAAFGNMMAKKESQTLRIRFEQYEFLIFFLSTFALTVSSLLITPFIQIYTRNISDVNYIRPLFGYLVCIAIFCTCIKLPYEQMVYAAGVFKDTRNGAFIEASVNIIISLVLVNFIGLNGIIIGTVIALLYRTLRYNIYVSKQIISRNSYMLLHKLTFSISSFCICYVTSLMMPLSYINNYFSWLKWATIVSIFVFAVCSILSALFFRNDYIAMLKLLKTVFNKAGIKKQ